MAYRDLLRDPRWQKKRLEIMERDGFECQVCGDNSSTLNVHHGYYGRRKKPWEYEDETLHTLCETCHPHQQSLLEETHKSLALLPLAEHRDEVLGYMHGCRYEIESPEPVGTQEPPPIPVTMLGEAEKLDEMNALSENYRNYLWGITEDFLRGMNNKLSEIKLYSFCYGYDNGYLYFHVETLDEARRRASSA